MDLVIASYDLPLLFQNAVELQILFTLLSPACKKLRLRRVSLQTFTEVRPPI